MTEQRTTNDTQPAPGRVPPHDETAENALLGAAMLSEKALEILVTRSRPEDFYLPRNAALAGLMADAYAEGWPPDPVALWHRIRGAKLEHLFGDNPNSLLEIQGSTPATSSAGAYATIVHDHATARRLIASAAEILEDGYGLADPHEALAKAQTLLEGVAASNGARNASTLEIADIGALLASDLEPVQADYLTRTDGTALLYAGKMHVFQAEPSAGKSWLALAATLDVLRVGGAVVYLDYEDTSTGILGRLLALGAEPSDVRERFAYVQPAGGFGPTEKADLARLLDRLNPDLVVIDGVAEALARDGLSEDRAAEVVGWIERLPRWIARTGAAVVMLDHVVKDREQQGRWARGSSAKLAAVDGASYQVKIATPFSRHRAGVVKMIVAKDRPGGIGAIGDVAAVATIEPHAGGARVVVTLDPNEVDVAPTDTWKPTVLMEKVSRALEDSTVELTASTLKTLVHSEKPKLVTEAIARLLAEGWIVEGHGKPKKLRIVTPYRRDAEPAGDAGPTAPTPEPELALDLEPGDPGF